MTILIVDDIPGNRRLLRAVLEAEGHHILEAVDGVEALEVLEKCEVNAIISDILMPRMDGYRLCYEIRSNERLRQTPFVFYTSGYTSDGDEKLALEMGADRYLVKPAPAAEILRVLEEAMTSQKGHLPPTEPSRDLNLMKEYNQQLVAKLEQKNMELTARNNELGAMQSQLQRLLDRSPVVHYQLKIEGRTITPVVISDNVYRQLGVSRENSMRYEWWLESLHPEDRERVLATFARGLKNGFYSMEYRLRQEDKTSRWLEDNGRVIRNATGEPVETVGVWIDITNRKQADEALRASEERYRATLDNILEGCQLIDFDWNYLYLNNAASRHNRRPNDELLGRKVMEAWPGIEDTEVFALFRRCMDQRVAIHQEVEFTFPGGDHGWFDLRCESAPEGIFLLSVEITERKQAEERVAGQLQELERWREVTLGREDRVQSLKNEINLLLRQAGQPPRYGVQAAEQGRLA